MASTSSSTASANGPPCKKQKSGGTFCSAYGCSNRSLRDKQSKHDRNFISYHQFPKDKELRSQWLARLKRDDFVPSPSTKICSDHFFINDFNEADVEKRLQPPAPGSKNRTMRLKSGSIPNTDSENGETDDDLPSWCGCGNCTPCPVQEEALCCNDREDTFSMLRSKGDCIIDEAFFRNQLLCEEALTFSQYTMSAMLRTDAERQRYYKKDFTNNLKRHLAYRNLLYYINKGCPLGRYNRVVLPRCVVVKIRETYPSTSGDYTGFKEVEPHASEARGVN